MSWRKAVFLSCRELLLLRWQGNRNGRGPPSAVLWRASQRPRRPAQVTRAGGVGLGDWNLRTNEVHDFDEWKRPLRHMPEEIADTFQEWRSRVHPDDLDPTIVRETQRLESFRTLAAGSAHDFNNLFTAATGNLSLLRHTQPGAPEMPALLRALEEATGRATALPKQLLAFAKYGTVRARAETIPTGQRARDGQAWRAGRADGGVILDLPLPGYCGGVVRTALARDT